MRKILWGGIALLVALLIASPALAQTVDSNTRASLGAALGTLDQTLDVTQALENQNSIQNEDAVDTTLEGIEQTLLNIQAQLAAGGTASIPTGFPNTGDYPD